MPRKTRCRRFLAVALCVLFVTCLACPAFAAGELYPMPGYVFAVSHTFPESSFVQDGNNYKVPAFTPSYKLEHDNSCVVTFCGQSIRLAWSGYSSEVYEMLYCIGNTSLIDASMPDTGHGFFLALYPGHKDQCFFVCTADFYRDYIEGTGDAGFTISFSVPERLTVPSLMDNIKSVFTSSLGMVGTAASTVAKQPILYLPIVIGLCGIGIAFYRRLKQ